MDAPRTGFVLVAAGSGTRLGVGRPKALVDLGGGTLLEHALRRLHGFPGRLAVAVAAPAGHLDAARRLASAALPAATPALAERADARPAHGDPDASPAPPAADDVTLAVVAGGASRQSSVAAAIDALPGDCDVVLVHDAARPFAPRALAERVAGAVRATGDGVVPVLPVVDTIKRLSGDRVVETPERSSLVAAQTPQGFPAPALREAYRSATIEHTDDAALAAAAGLRVRTVPGDVHAFKITRPDDLERASRMLAGASEPSVRFPGHRDMDVAEGSRGLEAAELRTGIGVDAHAFDDTAPLHLACLYWPGEPGLAGHSDGDAVAHAICDALLAAAGLGDIGSVFGTDDPELAGAGGALFLRRTRALLDEHGASIRNVSVQFVAERPRFAARRDEARTALEAVLEAPVSIAATTSDRLGFTGRRDGLIAIATALVAVAPPR
ncbi:bifunctional enzyme IspD/IspF [Pseudoclavibacter endophyticus]|uniref:Bifunctional enzyme IspD/IspF n=2 Tax=Pseudoclavibacter endophyticus TaxID=1778590 RepID=A0A6H9WSY3_9MICO|nr:2-C-methyl-D-erythritol 2,4-cyclodiphosphate synthase [Pseudoclavibacter endophyticus]KAB1649410.1 2-C-methyl-D-erythritol 2,4-cyclodiphosphate synthase [Pseudoclavibacter endophyticus]GGA62855.1 bifunctional enzyme IspD/IspF [Pseudoclavibacter endophyticus]